MMSRPTCASCRCSAPSNNPAAATERYCRLDPPKTVVVEAGAAAAMGIAPSMRSQYPIVLPEWTCSRHSHRNPLRRLVAKLLGAFT